MEPARRSATYADLLALADDVRAEILGGTIVTSPAPLPRHSHVQQALARFVGGPFHNDDGRGGPGGWIILLEVDVRLEPHEVVRPDVSGWRRERFTEPWDKRPLEVVPDWTCEIVSPSYARWDRVYKRNLYAKHGVGFYWIADPVERTLETMRLEGESWMETGSYDAASVARIPPFDAIEIEVGRLFAPVSASP